MNELNELTTCLCGQILKQPLLARRDREATTSANDFTRYYTMSTPVHSDGTIVDCFLRSPTLHLFELSIPHESSDCRPSPPKPCESPIRFDILPPSLSKMEPSQGISREHSVFRRTFPPRSPLRVISPQSSQLKDDGLLLGARTDHPGVGIK